MSAAGWTTFPLALCASCVLHGGAIAMLEGGSHSDAGIAATSRPWLTVSLGTAPPSTSATLVSAGAGRAVLPPAFGVAPGMPAAGADERQGGLAAPLPPPFLAPVELDQVPRPQGELDFAQAMPGVLSDHGRLVLVIFINALGRVEKVDIEASDMPDVYGASAVETLRGATFSPGEKNGRPANSRIRMEISYD